MIRQYCKTKALEYKDDWDMPELVKKWLKNEDHVNGSDIVRIMFRIPSNFNTKTCRHTRESRGKVLVEMSTWPECNITLECALRLCKETMDDYIKLVKV